MAQQEERRDLNSCCREPRSGAHTCELGAAQGDRDGFMLVSGAPWPDIEGRMVGNGPVNQSNVEMVLINVTHEKGEVYGYQERGSDSMARE